MSRLHGRFTLGDVIRQRQFLRRNRHRLALLAVLGGLAFALAAEHSGLQGAHADDGMTDAVSMCLAVLGVGVAAIGAAALVRAPTRRRAPRDLAPTTVAACAIPPTAAPHVRGSPPLLQVFLR